MRYLPTSLLLVLLVLAIVDIPSTKAATLRQTRDSRNELPNSLEVEFSAAEFRALQTDGDGTDGDGTEEQESSDAGLINRIIQFLLPFINESINRLVPDPLEIPVAGEWVLGEINLLACTASAGFSYNLGSLNGLSSLVIDNLSVILGTERVDAGLCNTLWGAAFDITVLSTEILSIEDLGAGFSASACGLSLEPKVGGGIRTYQPFMSGAVNMTGSLSALSRRAKIDWSDIQGALNVDYDRIDAYMDNVPAAFNTFIGNVTSRLSVQMKEQWVSTVEPEVNPKVDESLMASEGRMSRSQLFAINSGFVRNSVRRQASALYNTVGNFFGGGEE